MKIDFDFLEDNSFDLIEENVYVREEEEVCCEIYVIGKKFSIRIERFFDGNIYRETCNDFQRVMELVKSCFDYSEEEEEEEEDE